MKGKPGKTHLAAPACLPVAFLQRKGVAALAKMEANGLGPPYSICAFWIRFQTKSSLQPSLWLIIVHKRFTAVAVAPTRGTGSSWADCSEVAFPPRGASTSSGAHEYSAVTSFDYCLWWLRESAAPESQGLTSVYSGKWMEMLLLLKITIKKHLQFLVVYWEKSYHCSCKAGGFETSQEGRCFEVLGVWMQFSLSYDLGHIF